MTEQITLDNLDHFAIGATVLGTGGGGDPYIGKLMAEQAIEEHGPVDLLPPTEVPDDALVVPPPGGHPSKRSRVSAAR